jgi:hypothetical protein
MVPSCNWEAKSANMRLPRTYGITATAIAISRQDEVCCNVDRIFFLASAVLIGQVSLTSLLRPTGNTLDTFYDTNFNPVRAGPDQRAISSGGRCTLSSGRS